MKFIQSFFRVLHGLVALLFAIAALMLIIISTQMGWIAFSGTWKAETAQTIIEAIGLLAAAVVGLQIAETITEEEVIRNADISAPTRVRRYLSRFYIVLIVALAIEGLVATFKALHQNLVLLPYASSLIGATGILLASWGLFVHLNRSSEDLEPEAMEEVKKEDEKLK